LVRDDPLGRQKAGGKRKRGKRKKNTSRPWFVMTHLAVKKQGGKEKGKNEKKKHLTSLVCDDPLGRQKSDWQVSCADQTSVKRDLL
jgi:hypothetical protein